MSVAFTTPNSPLDQLQRRKTRRARGSTKGLSAREQAMLEEILTEPVDYMDDPVFHEKDAEQKVFDEAPEIPEPNTSWYHPVMDNLSQVDDPRKMVSVVLTGKQEKALFLQFNYCRFRARELQDKIGDGPAEPAVARELLKWYRKADELRERIAQCNLALVLAMAKRMRHSDLDFTDLVSEGNIALVRAIDKFNVSRGFKFSTYACSSILKAFGRSGKKHTRYRQMFPTDFDPALERSNFQERLNEEREEDCASEVGRIVRMNVADLTDVEREVINHRFALEHPNPSEAESLTLDQVGKLVGLTKERVRQIQNKALTKLRKALEENYIDSRSSEEEAEAETAQEAAAETAEN